MKVLMFGWEFPPFNTGGLGTACLGLTKSLCKKGTKITFVLPKKAAINADYMNVCFAGVNTKDVKNLISTYSTTCCYTKDGKLIPVYGNKLMDQVCDYANKVKDIILSSDFDVIHAHDWLTFKAGVLAKKLTGKPLVVHVHATEFDRGGGNGVNQQVYDIERMGVHAADKVVTVSEFTKQKIVEHYNINPDKIKVVHNGVELPTNTFSNKYKRDKMVLYLGRVTLQKGPDYFLYTAKKVLNYCPNTKFVMAGKGDMLQYLINKSLELGINKNFIFTGYIADEAKNNLYQMADLFVMPSVSEPFGITPLESLGNGTPVLISKQSGVSEVLTHCLKTDFWDVDDMTNKIVSVLKHQELKNCLSINGHREVGKINWDSAATKCINVYKGLIGA